MKKLAKKFLQTLPEKLNLITEAYKNKDWKMLEGASHKLKGLGGAFGYPKITDLAQIVNDLTRENKYSELDKAVNDLQTLCNNVLNNNAV